MSITNAFNSEGLINILSLLTSDNRHYKIPSMQRNYVWSKQNIIDFIEDIREAMEAEEATEYFIGGMVFALNEDPNSHFVVDGQQRITTITLLLAAANYISKEQGEEGIADYWKKLIFTAYLHQGKMKQTSKLTHHNTDNQFYQALIELSQPISSYQPQNVSQKNMWTAMDTILEEVSAMPHSELVEFMEYLIGKVYVIPMVCSSLNMAFRIFETLNDRGAKLQPEDLLKNLLLRNLSDEEYENGANHWTQFINVLSNENGKPYVSASTFLKHYLASKGRYVSKNKIYETFEKNESVVNIQNADEIFNLLNDLYNNAQYYVGLLNGGGTEEIQACLEVGVKQSLIIGLASRHLDAQKQKKIHELLESLVFSYVAIGARFNTLERSFPEISTDLQSEDRYDQAIGKIKDLILDKKEAALSSIAQLKLGTASEKKKVTYMLRKLAQSLDGGNYSSLTIEHIMPENKGTGWNHVKEEGTEYKLLVNRLGNLTLLPKPVNSSLKNKSFKEKIEAYKTQNTLTRAIVLPISNTGTSNTVFDKSIKAYQPEATNSWEVSRIEKRTSAMIRLANHIWYEKHNI